MKNNHPLEYQMTKRMFKELLNTRTGADEKKDPYEYVMQIINETFGLKGTVVQLSII